MLIFATMRANGVTRLLTFNEGDFQRETGVTILTPEA